MTTRRMAPTGAAVAAPVLTTDEAQRLHDATLAVIESRLIHNTSEQARVKGWSPAALHADQERLASDLAGLQRALEGLRDHELSEGTAHLCECWTPDRPRWVVGTGPPYDCPDAVRYTADAQDRVNNLIRTAALYGVTP